MSILMAAAGVCARDGEPSLRTRAKRKNSWANRFNGTSQTRSVECEMRVYRYAGIAQWLAQRDLGISCDNRS